MYIYSIPNKKKLGKFVDVVAVGFQEQEGIQCVSLNTVAEVGLLQLQGRKKALNRHLCRGHSLKQPGNLLDTYFCDCQNLEKAFLR